LTDYIEKPEYSFKVSMGIYVISPTVLPYIPADQRFDFPDLVHRLLNSGGKIQTFPFNGIWLDIGRSEDYAGAAEMYEQHLARLLPANAAYAQTRMQPAAESP
jgi:NDP-sugar pyrophosphorylase family protein